MSRCEDYPCCGHTDGLGCNYDTSYYSSQEYHNYINIHYGCDHEAGWCAVELDDEDEVDLDPVPAQHYSSEFGPQW